MDGCILDIFCHHYQETSEKANELLQYMALIWEARCGGSLAWRIHDENFRMRQAVQPQSWSSINSDLWLRTMTLQPHPQQSAHVVPTSASMAHRPTHNVFTPASAPNRRSVRPCFDFNSIRGCTFKTCKYDHVCLACIHTASTSVRGH